MATLLYYVTSDVYYPLEKGHELNSFIYFYHWHILLVRHIGDTSQPESTRIPMSFTASGLDTNILFH